MPTQPLLYSQTNVLEHRHVKTTSVVLCAMIYPPIIQVNIYGEIAGTGDL
jgi:ACR3 family arsenite efflux pump ArsB